MERTTIENAGNRVIRRGQNIDIPVIQYILSRSYVTYKLSYASWRDNGGLDGLVLMKGVKSARISDH